ncbi:DUF4145 domain-containing protein [Enterococcus hirae]|uniref:DUF4145 domain-containing protein n=1 Tax=Enterococcus hirae TaxID=1354 RepID=UPI001F4FD031|nr:DUF4145 domain-containing protein [Enterococcus hirae]
MKNYLCPHCNSYFALSMDTQRKYTHSFEYANPHEAPRVINTNHELNSNIDSDIASTIFYKCPACEKITIEIKGEGSLFENRIVQFYPDLKPKNLPDYIPESIKQDYKEAFLIAKLSPKASATLSRRCLQGMIRDYWQVSGKRNLAEEIDSIRDEISPQVKKVLDSVRQIGNIGAHMEKDINKIVDIEPNEAQQLLNLIEYLVEQWYVQRNETELMLTNIISMNDEKQSQRKI